MRTKTKKRPPISQKAFDSRMKEMGYEVWETGGGCEAYGKEISMFGRTFEVLFTSDLELPDVNDHEFLMGGVYEGSSDEAGDRDRWDLKFSDAKVLLKFAEKVEEHVMAKAWDLLRKSNKRKGPTQVDSNFFGS